MKTSGMAYGKTVLPGLLAILLFSGGCASPRLGLLPDGESVRFVFQTPRAENVTLVLLPEEKPPLEVALQTSARAGGIWSVSLGLEPGEYRYFYRVDGRVVADPASLRSAIDDFGDRNSIFAVEQVPGGRVLLH